VIRAKSTDSTLRPFIPSFSVFGSDNIVKAGVGPAALAGAIGMTHQTIGQSGPGVNINIDIKVGGAAAVDTAKASAPATATAHHTAGMHRGTRVTTRQ
jgi:hypothetical protein